MTTETLDRVAYINKMRQCMHSLAGIALSHPEDDEIPDIELIPGSRLSCLSPGQVYKNPNRITFAINGDSDDTSGSVVWDQSNRKGYETFTFHEKGGVCFYFDPEISDSCIEVRYDMGRKPGTVKILKLHMNNGNTIVQVDTTKLDTINSCNVTHSDEPFAINSPTSLIASDAFHGAARRSLWWLPPRTDEKSLIAMTMRAADTLRCKGFPS